MSHDVEAVLAQILEPGRGEIERLEAEQHDLAVHQTALGVARGQRQAPQHAQTAQGDAAGRGEQQRGSARQVRGRFEQERLDGENGQRDQPDRQGLAQLPDRAQQTMVIVDALEVSDGHEHRADDQACSDG
ncbi:hypothetical protein ACVWXN_006305 [Bradyrhizobium sp. i1.4.4]